MIAKVIFVLLAIICLGAADPQGNCPRILSKAQWGGREATDINYLIVPIPYVIIHHTVTPQCTTRATCSARAESIQSYHMDSLHWQDIGYSFLIGGDGEIYEGCGWTHEGAHTYRYNKRSVGIAFIGNFQDTAAPQKMLDAAHKLILCGKEQGILRDNVKVLGAKQLHSTLSPGFELYTQIQSWPEWSASP